MRSSNGTIVANCNNAMTSTIAMTPLVAEKNVQGFRAAIGKNVTNGTIGRFADFTNGGT